jgi:SAM-dependent methyltransferase
MTDYYRKHASEFVSRTSTLNLGDLYQPFLRLLPPGARVLDAGCGSGRDAKEFLRRGYRVTAIDASAEMVATCTKEAGVSALCLRFQEMEFVREFDGIWACASLLHVPTREMKEVLDRFWRALIPEGAMYVSFKLGNGERIDGERLFNDYDEWRLTGLFSNQGGFRLVSVWRTPDVRPERTGEQWVNAIAIRTGN